jgi:hypothetical protein
MIKPVEIRPSIIQFAEQVERALTAGGPDLVDNEPMDWLIDITEKSVELAALLTALIGPDGEPCQDRPKAQLIELRVKATFEAVDIAIRCLLLANLFDVRKEFPESFRSEVEDAD